ncbi:transporter substrate-binding domain-containing protein [Leeia sp. TBRC 13508]|uniref:Transporter substrate-binding domain-containing protein n=1 Tax=Leeia speluncae TaxID=2884804 RepID=A0ABS8D4D2_9NEIS|nr:transporter substrate-binding domain-containing protein [Leeia speluncae]MCB6183034.1 transporter substrate-binding domain-containing protein [Leeia speluncae]
MTKQRRLLGIGLCGLISTFTQAETLKIAIQGALPPFDYMEGGQVKGFNVEITHALCADMKVTCVVVKTPWEELIPSVSSGKVDAVISSMSITAERQKIVSFSERYTRSPASFVAKKKKYLTTYITALDLKGKTAGAQAGTIYENLMRGRYPEVPLKTFSTTADMYKSLQAGEIDIALDDMVSAYYGYVQTPAGKGLELVGSPIRDSKYMGIGEGVVVKLNNKALANRFSTAITNIRKSGVYQQIMNKYFMFNVY